MKFSIIPGILTQSKEDVKEKVQQAALFSERVSIDVIDGLYADNWTVAPSDLTDFDWKGLQVDMQLMVEEPVDWLSRCRLAGATRVFGHIERMSDRELFLAEANEQNLSAGWGVDLYTPIEELSNTDLLRADGVLLMSVKAGFSGQEFNELVLDKITYLREKGFDGDIVVDGGMSAQTIPACLQAGANQFSVTSALWESENVKSAYQSLQLVLEEKK